MSLVKDYMTPCMVTRDSKDTILEICKAMSEWRISSIAITEEMSRQIIGVLTERDIVRGIAKGMNPEVSSADSLMSTPVLSIRNDRSIQDVVQVMIKHKVRHLLVEDLRHGVAGIITTTDVARCLKQSMQYHSKNEDQQLVTQMLPEAWELFF